MESSNKHQILSILVTKTGIPLVVLYVNYCNWKKLAASLLKLRSPSRFIGNGLQITVAPFDRQVIWNAENL